ncbi:NAD(P)-binding protein [Ideonella sp. 4Y11]|uniref:NAD(P)-binding protein n=1 Tax=Ideonella aquatica TaxID=2824119 RepID=A0A940YJR7_9BURK|nr:NAD(P)-binding protein [Ideonella aquatica]MBQ0959149.1 NAD(P)-binding protein [Ideonella aquatica]
MDGTGHITRRDLIHGAALSALGASAQAGGFAGQTDADNAVAHAWRDQPSRWDNQAVLRDEDEPDLLVVGAGISGLAGAWWFREHAGRPVTIRVLEAASELGGHARRNTFTSRSGATLIGYGGSQSLDSPSLFSPAVHALLRGVGVDLQRFDTAFDQGWHQRHGLSSQAVHFGRADWGQARTVWRAPGEAPAAWLARTPLGARAQRVLARLFDETSTHNPLPGLRSRSARAAVLARQTYAQFLRRGWGADSEALRWFQVSTQGYFGVGIDATTALDAWAVGLPGFQALDLGERPFAANSPSGRQLRLSTDDYIHHFPDGNAGVVRALLRALLPAALPGAEGMDGLVDAPLLHDRLDEPGQPLRIGLRHTVVGLRHLGPPGAAQRVELRYLDPQGRLRSVRAKQVLLACWHRVIARLTDELPAAQRRALDDQVKVPLLYTNVLLSNWRAFKAAGISGIRCVDGFWGDVALDFPVALGRQRPPASPDEPILLHLGKVVVPGGGAPAREQAAAGRKQLLGWDFGFIEGQVRTLLDEALGAHGFDSARDIEAITVNRWAHGYAYEYMRPWDAWWPRGPLPCETARRGWGRVAIANSDAGAYAYAHSAIDQATRAVQELLPAARLPEWQRFPGPAMPS